MEFHKTFEFHKFSSLSINMKTQLTPQSMNLITSSKNMNYNFNVFLTKPTIVKRFLLK